MSEKNKQMIHVENTEKINDEFILKICDFIEDMSKEIKTEGEYNLLLVLGLTCKECMAIEENTKKVVAKEKDITTYEEYLINWAETSTEQGSPMSRKEWEKVKRLKETPKGVEYFNTYRIYDKIMKLILEINDLRCELNNDKVHIQLLGEKLFTEYNDKYYKAIETFWKSESGMINLKKMLLEKI